MGVLAVIPGHDFQQLMLHFLDILARGQAGAVGDPEDVGVHGDGGVAEGNVQDDVGGLAADARQGFEGGAVIGHFAAMLVDEDLAHGQQVLRLVAEEPDGADGFGDVLQPQLDHGLRGGGQRKEPSGDDVDALVGGLGREQHGGQQLIGAAVFQFGLGIGVGGGQTPEHLLAVRRAHAVGRGRGIRMRARMAARRRAFSSVSTRATLGSRSRVSAVPGAGCPVVGDSAWAPAWPAVMSEAPFPEGAFSAACELDACGAFSRWSRRWWCWRPCRASDACQGLASGTREMQSVGQGGRHSSQPVQRSVST